MPLRYLHGAGNIVSGLEQSLHGRQACDTPDHRSLRCVRRS
ncbi:hypothetical protein [Xanthomonas floridensis]